MSDDKPTETPADETPPSGTSTDDKPTESAAEPNIEVPAKTLRHLYMDSLRLRRLQDMPRRALTTVDLDLKVNAMLGDDSPDSWEGNSPGLYIKTKCGHFEGLEAIYYRATLGLRCRACKKLAIRVKVAAGAPPATSDGDDE